MNATSGPPPADARAQGARPPLLRRLPRPVVAGVTALALLGGVAACGTAQDPAASSSTTSGTSSSGSTEVVPAAADGWNTAEVVAAAEAFMATLTDEQLETLFGLVHGTAFATTILDLQLDTGATLWAVLGFVGVELAQLVAVLVVLPVVVLMSRSRAYPVVRTGLAGAGSVAAVAWAVAVLTGGESVLQPAFDVVSADRGSRWWFLAAVAWALWELFPRPSPADRVLEEPGDRSGEPVAAG